MVRRQQRPDGGREGAKIGGMHRTYCRSTSQSFQMTWEKRYYGSSSRSGVTLGRYSSQGIEIGVAVNMAS